MTSNNTVIKQRKAILLPSIHQLLPTFERTTSIAALLPGTRRMFVDQQPVHSPDAAISGNDYCFTYRLRAAILRDMLSSVQARSKEANLMNYLTTLVLALSAAAAPTKTSPASCQ